MNFEPGDDQRAILEAVDLLLARHAGPARAIELAAKGGYDDALDAALEAAGFADVASATATGLLDAALLVEAVARAGGVAAIGAGALIAPALTGRMLAGPIAVASADATGPVRFAAHARTLLIRDGDVARVAELRPGDVAPVRSNFGFPMGRIKPAALGRGDALAAASGARLDALWRVALAAETVGAMRAALDVTVEYAKRRRQFGRAIGSFQAVQHRLAECFVWTEGARWLALEAAWAGAPAEAAATAAAHALAAAGRVFEETHQLSGAMGYTREHDLHVFSMRLPALRLEAGGVAAQRRAVDGRALGECMNSGLALDFDDAQQAIRDAIASFCRDRCPDAVAKAAAQSFPHALWRELAQLGVFAIATPEGEGGAVELVAAFEALGRAVHPGPLVETAFAMQLLPPAQRARVASGDALVSIGTPPLLAWAPLAAVFVALDGDAAWLADVDGAIEPVATLGGEPWGRVALARRAPLGDATRAQSLAQIALAAYLAAAGRRLVDAAAEHAKARRQFGRAIATFQAVSHPLADAVIGLDAATTLARVAAWEWDAQVATASMRAAAARLSASRTAESAAHAAHQVFGALGVMRDGPAFFASRRILQLVATPPGPRPAHAMLLAAAGLDDVESPA